MIHYFNSQRSSALGKPLGEFDVPLTWFCTTRWMIVTKNYPGTIELDRSSKQ
jgi:hypothetical protein